MGTESTKHFRVHCNVCKSRDDYENMDLATSEASEHNTIIHNGKKHTEIGQFYPRENYWGFKI